MGFSWFFMYFIQHCFIPRSSDSTVSEDAGIGTRTFATLALVARCFICITSRLNLIHKILRRILHFTAISLGLRILKVMVGVLPYRDPMATVWMYRRFYNQQRFLFQTLARLTVQSEVHYINNSRSFLLSFCKFSVRIIPRFLPENIKLWGDIPIFLVRIKLFILCPMSQDASCDTVFL